jgi:hypothetical protein
MQWNQVKNVRENQCAYTAYDLYIIYIYIFYDFEHLNLKSSQN